MPDTALVIVARYPEAGKTKTRLARTLGAQEAANLYRCFLQDLATRFSGQPYSLHWAYTPAHIDFQSFISTLSPHVAPMICIPQQGDDFATRLHNVFHWTAAHGYKHTVLIASDSPHIRQETIEAALVALDDTDVVLGPSDDGGYYLLGMHQPHDIFSNIPMSTDVVARMTIDSAQRQKLAIRLLPPLFDIDEMSDLIRLATLLREDRALAPATADHLATIANPTSIRSTVQ